MELNKIMEECDMLFCSSTHNVQPLSKYINVCESCWFSIMNGIHRWNNIEKDHIRMLEDERKK
jgi:hypothetical protein